MDAKPYRHVSHELKRFHESRTSDVSPKHPKIPSIVSADHSQLFPCVKRLKCVNTPGISPVLQADRISAIPIRIFQPSH
jgi:hypothetical protein